MAKTLTIEVKKLSLDLKNYRTIEQLDELSAVISMKSINHRKLYGLLEGIIDDGFSPLENILVLKQGDKYIVKEGNRRVACLKMILGLINPNLVGLPPNIIEKISAIDDVKRKSYRKVSCLVHEETESAEVNRLIALVHGKGEEASRDDWTSIARARHNRDQNDGTEVGLDLLEKFLNNEPKISDNQKNRWPGDYGVTILNEALRIIQPKTTYSSALEIVEKYPNIYFKGLLDELIIKIGLKQIGFQEVRAINFTDEIGLDSLKITLEKAIDEKTENSTNDLKVISKTEKNITPKVDEKINPIVQQNNLNVENPTLNLVTTNIASRKVPKSFPVDDVRSVKNRLKTFIPTRENRDKVLTIKKEMLSLNIENNPLAFTLLLRSMLEISAKLFAKENSISTKKPNGFDKSLEELVKEIYNKLISIDKSEDFKKSLYSAKAEITGETGILSITSMNQLVHNKNFMVTSQQVSIGFSNIFPLLQQLN